MERREGGSVNEECERGVVVVRTGERESVFNIIFRVPRDVWQVATPVGS